MSLRNKISRESCPEPSYTQRFDHLGPTSSFRPCAGVQALRVFTH